MIQYFLCDQKWIGHSIVTSLRYSSLLLDGIIIYKKNQLGINLKPAQSEPYFISTLKIRFFVLLRRVAPIEQSVNRNIYSSHLTILLVIRTADFLWFMKCSMIVYFLMNLQLKNTARA